MAEPYCLAARDNGRMRCEPCRQRARDAALTASAADAVETRLRRVADTRQPRPGRTVAGAVRMPLRGEGGGVERFD